LKKCKDSSDSSVAVELKKQLKKDISKILNAERLRDNEILNDTLLDVPQNSARSMGSPRFSR
jgi:hypothetical protein